MIKRIDVARLIERSTPLLILLAIVVLVSGSIGQINRWDLLDQISMADNFVQHGTLYPAADSEVPFGVSAYFPGVALLAVLLKYVGLEHFLVEAMLMVACALVVLLFVMFAKATRATFAVACTVRDLAPLAICVVFVVCPMWLRYAREFKPDTVALCCGLLGLHIAGWLRSDTSFGRILAGALICGLAIVFKQQYAAFLVGLLIFAVVQPTRSRILFALIALAAAAAVVGVLFLAGEPWFWNVKVLSDDGLLSPGQVVRDNVGTAFALFQALVIVGLIRWAAVPAGNEFKEFFPLRRDVGWLSSAWVWIAVPSIGAAFLSALKVGGNQGNTQLGLVLLLPIVYALTQRLDRKVFVALGWCAILPHVPAIHASLNNYAEAVALRGFVAAKASPDDRLVLTGSDVYFASRVYVPTAKIVNYWTVGGRDGVDVEVSLSRVLANVTPDVLIVENWPGNKSAVLGDSRYELVFENTVGFVARRQAH